MLEINKIHCGDCLELMKEIEDQSVDMILCDLPYGSISCSWDTIIPFNSLWEQYRRIVKPNSAIILTAKHPFASALVGSNAKNYKHCWYWKKHHAANFMNAKHQPLDFIEQVLVFSFGKVNYFPVPEKQSKGLIDRRRSKRKEKCDYHIGKHYQNGETYTRNAASTASSQQKWGIEYGYPGNVLDFVRDKDNFHPTQKPVALFEYLIKTYSNEGDLVLDNCAGSGTTGAAAIKTKRNFILIEKDENYCNLARERLSKIDAVQENLF